MKHFVKIKHLSFYALLFLMLSCSKDDDEPKAVDKEGPAVSIANLEDEEVVRNEVEIKVEATDEGGIAKIEIYIDGELTTSLDTPPYNYTWNTTEVEEGDHVIKVVATDASGNETAYI